MSTCSRFFNIFFTLGNTSSYAMSTRVSAYEAVQTFFPSLEEHYSQSMGTISAVVHALINTCAMAPGLFRSDENNQRWQEDIGSVIASEPTDSQRMLTELGAHYEDLEEEEAFSPVSTPWFLRVFFLIDMIGSAAEFWYSWANLNSAIWAQLLSILPTIGVARTMLSFKLQKATQNYHILFDYFCSSGNSCQAIFKAIGITILGIISAFPRASMRFFFIYLGAQSLFDTPIISLIIASLLAGGCFLNNLMTKTTTLFLSHVQPTPCWNAEKKYSTSSYLIMLLFSLLAIYELASTQMGYSNSALFMLQQCASADFYKAWEEYFIAGAFLLALPGTIEYFFYLIRSAWDELLLLLECFIPASSLQESSVQTRGVWGAFFDTDNVKGSNSEIEAALLLRV